MAYEAIVTKVHTRPHPNAERLKLGTCEGYQVVVGLDTQDGELGVFFPSDGQLSDEFVRANSLYSESAILKMGEHPQPGQHFGFFSDKRRVRSQSFRGEKSDGFWVPLSYFDYIPGLSFLEKYTFTELEGHEICQKYFTPATLRAQGQKVGKRQRENLYFRKHDVTKQFKHVSEAIPRDAIYYITEKLHGTSGRFGRVLDEIELPFWKRLINRFVSIYPSREYRYLNGSKNVILEKTTGEGYYGTNEFRHRSVKDLTLHKGEVLYFEIVGWVSDQTRIMPAHPIKDEVKSLRKQYGDQMDYLYGCPEGTSQIYVYKIVMNNEDGIAYDLPWMQVKQRCYELGINHVPELGSGPFVSLDYVKEVLPELTDGPSTLSPKHIREGVVLRVEASDGTTYIKNKSFFFGVLEGYIKDFDDYVDIEEAN